MIENPTSRLEAYLHAHIPLSKAMEVSVVCVEPERVVLSAPLAPNINHRDTLFGGSASAVAILAAWSLLHTRLTAEGVPSRVVIQRNQMLYEAPICGSFTATAALSEPAAWAAFFKLLQRKGRGRIAISSVLKFEGAQCGQFEGEFVAFTSR